MSSHTHHLDLVASIAERVRSAGAAEALAELRETRPGVVDGEYHDTYAVFFVWAVDRLVTAGLSPTAVLWHPLVHADSPSAWWSAEELSSPAARESFVAPTGLLAGEPIPAVPAQRALAAA